jgi:hypothetical protein
VKRKLRPILYTGATSETPVLGDTSTIKVNVENNWKASIVIPAEAKTGSKFVVNLEVTDKNDVDPMTNFVQYVVNVA